MASNIIGNRNSTPEASKPSLRPPTSRILGSTSTHNQPVRSSADMSFASPLSARSMRPASEVLYNQQSQQGGLDDSSKLGEQWIQDIEQYETMLEEMAAATLDQDFKDELSAIEQWFRVLSEAERTAATYALIQQTTQMQQRFFAQVLNQMSKSHPISGVLSPANFGEKDPMSSRLSDAMSKLNVDDRRTSMGRPPVSPAGNKRNSGLDQSTIHAMFPDAVAAIQQQKAEYAQQTGNPPPSNRNSTVIGDRSSLVAPIISAPRESKSDALSWRQGGDSHQLPISRPKSSSGQPPMGQFSQPASSGALRSPRPMGGPAGNIQSTTLTAPEQNEMPMLSPYNVGNQSWASMTNTPMVPNFNQAGTHSDMVANATAMKLAALSTVNNRIALDDAKKYRRARSNEPSPHSQPPLTPGVSSTGIPGINTIMINDQGQILNAQQVAAIQAQQFAAAQGRRSRPNSPGLPMQTPLGQTNFASPQHNGFLAAYDGAPIMMGAGMPGLMAGMGSFGGAEGYLSDHSEIARGRSPRGRRGSSKPPEDPTDPSLLQDIPTWLRSLRLHKYTDNLKDLKWQELVELDEKGLEARGVNALGARNKMLKVFEQVREARTDGKL
ncbi:Flap-structured DNA-binding and RNA-binding protein [Exophiala xenobiotica]|nr:Flap-structured DNA-binding and RNA-binding protein [Exophiala xenobiotica]KAK5233240.1 Flap-structured DNA-binding and RNA-binding protein [Exophiala xenobiotica]KAK5243328.1 Flap-structured DNA-binding and RNA-binding protein [Exophiala xenobiotica]KAK5351086.1 Flap-structured DNA-binding and RNA-binding protein [Exophiala xenobiotica]KAK5374064.1 Flap-structured DNA-binding and RNA-binding protein [Exophiala xenobiotica]